MASKSRSKEDLEIVFNLHWKNKANGDDKPSVICVCDIPATTLNWEVFKAYLLKNSGTSAEDVKISYVTDNGKEYSIQSQTYFQVALYAFRKKARNGDIINLKLERISDIPVQKTVKYLNVNVETQSEECHSLGSTCDMPPEWFLGYMNQLKKEITEELTATVSSVVSNALANIKPPQAPQNSCHHVRKSKESSSKRRKHHSYIGEAISDTKHLLKTLKHERKLEEKLESLESRTKKLKEKKLALFNEKSSDSDGAHGGAKPKIKTSPKVETISETSKEKEPENDDQIMMNAEPVKQNIRPHMLGGEIYMHQWQVVNTGNAPWTSKTTLQFTWGSKALEPLEKVISVPYLKPGEKGLVAVRLQIPTEPGQYECYWHFMHKGRRFGHWLGCQIIVDPFDLKGNSSVLDPVPDNTQNTISNSENYFDIDQYFENGLINEVPTVSEQILNNPAPNRSVHENNEPTDTNCSSDSDNQSVVSVLSGDSNFSKCSKDDFVLVDDKNDTEICDDNNNNSQNGSEKDMVVITVSKEQNQNDFACVIIDGQKIMVPKHILKDEFVEVSQQNSISSNASTATPSVQNEPIKDENTPLLNIQNSPELVDLNPNNDLSHCSATGSCFSDINSASRLFIFPQSCPGYEVVLPQTLENTQTQIEPENIKTSPPKQENTVNPPLNLSTHDRNPFINESMPHVPNLQQSPQRNMYVEENRRNDIPGAEPVHILPENLVSGAVNVASSAINTARSVINMVMPREPGRWVNGHWVATPGVESPREANLQALADMGFWNRDLNATLLARYKDDLNRVVAELVQ